MMTREQIVTSMCYTWRHDYGLEKNEHDGPGGLVSVGLTDHERRQLWRDMAQLFDHHIAPLLEENRQLKSQLADSNNK